MTLLTLLKPLVSEGIQSTKPAEFRDRFMPFSPTSQSS